MGEGSDMPTDPHHTPIITQPSLSQPQRKQKFRRPKEKDTEIPQSSVPSDPTNIADEAVTEEPSMQLKELMDFCTKLQQIVLDLENTKTAQAQEITSLKKRVKRLEKKGKSRTHKLKRLCRVCRSARVVSSKEAILGDQEDASKQGRKIDDIDADAEITLVDESQGRHNDDLVFDTYVLNNEVFAGQDMAEKEVSTADPVTTAGEVVTTANVEVSTASPTTATITNVELTLAQTLAELKSARPKTKGVVMQEPSESITTTTTTTIPSKDKGWKPKDLKTKSFANVQELFDKAMAEVAVDAIPLANKPPSIVDWNIIKEGKIGYYQIIRANGNLRRYSSMIQMLKSFDKEDLETLWKLVKAKHGYSRPKEGYERVLWGVLKTMFEHNIEDTMWRNLLRNKMLIWKLFDSCRVHFVRFYDMHIFMLVEKRHPLHQQQLHRC
ncbi:hypothetical protein Tco_0308097 [Tanacetum coccineum]